MLTFAKPSQTYLGGGIGIDGPALTPVLTFSPRATVWLCCICTPPAFTFVLTFILVFPFLKFRLRLIAARAAAHLFKLPSHPRYCYRTNIFTAWESNWRGV